MKKIVTRNQGITLIALIITIIVLLILAGISIQIAIGDNSILKKSIEARENYNASSEKELVNLSVSTARMESSDFVTIEKPDLNNSLDDYFGENGYTLEGEGPYKITIVESSRKYIVDEFGNIRDFHPVDSLQVGDLVNYTYDPADSVYNDSQGPDAVASNTNQTIVQTKNSVTWSILNIDSEMGRIDLISTKPVLSSVYLRSAPGYLNGVNFLNEICAKHYSNKALGVTARSIKLEDVYNCMKPSTVDLLNSKKVGINVHTSGQYPTLLQREVGFGYSADSINETGLKPSDTVNNVEEIGFWTKLNSGESIALRQTYATIDAEENNASLYKSEQAFNLLFGSTTKYWVASRYINRYSDTGTMMGIYQASNQLLNGGGMAYAGNYYAGITARVRPVVTIYSDVLNNDCEKVDGVWQLNY